jgi:hypothetical protein
MNAAEHRSIQKRKGKKGKSELEGGAELLPGAARGATGTRGGLGAWGKYA